MSLNSDVLETFDALLPAPEDSILFKEPDPGRQFLRNLKILEPSKNLEGNSPLYYCTLEIY